MAWFGPEALLEGWWSAPWEQTPVELPEHRETGALLLRSTFHDGPQAALVLHPCGRENREPIGPRIISAKANGSFRYLAGMALGEGWWFTCFPSDDDPVSFRCTWDVPLWSLRHRTELLRDVVGLFGAEATIEIRDTTVPIVLTAHCQNERALSGTLKKRLLPYRS